MLDCIARGGAQIHPAESMIDSKHFTGEGSVMQSALERFCLRLQLRFFKIMPHIRTMILLLVLVCMTALHKRP